MKDFELTDEEIKNISSFQLSIQSDHAELGNLRRRYLKKESSLILSVQTAENELLSYIKMVAKNKGIDLDKKWNFDSNSYKLIQEDTDSEE